MGNGAGTTPEGRELRFRAGTRPGVAFHVRHAGQAERVETEEGPEYVLHDWSSVGVRSILKAVHADSKGKWFDAIHFHELEPADEQNEVAVQGFYVRGRFKVVRHEKHSKLANVAWKSFYPR